MGGVYLAEKRLGRGERGVLEYANNLGESEEGVFLSFYNNQKVGGGGRGGGATDGRRPPQNLVRKTRSSSQ